MNPSAFLAETNMNLLAFLAETKASSIQGAFLCQCFFVFLMSVCLWCDYNNQ